MGLIIAPMGKDLAVDRSALENCFPHTDSWNKDLLAYPRFPYCGVVANMGEKYARMRN